MHNLVIIKLLFLFFMLLPLEVSATSSDDSYLQALDAEAESSSNLQNKKPLTYEKDPRLNQKMRHNEFNKRLSKELPATTRAYNKLTNENKQKVVDTYFANKKNMSVATRLLFNLYFKQKTSN